MTAKRQALRPSTEGAFRAKPDCCAGCRQPRRLTFHHLIPKKLHRRTHFRRHYSKAQLNEGLMVCRDCHKGIHRLYDEMTLAKQFCTPSQLLLDEALQKHFSWVAKLRISR